MQPSTIHRSKPRHNNHGTASRGANDSEDLVVNDVLIPCVYDVMITVVSDVLSACVNEELSDYTPSNRTCGTNKPYSAISTSWNVKPWP